MFQLVLTALKPTGGAVAGAGYIVVRSGIFDAFVKGHGDIRPQGPLDQHTFLRSHEDVAAIGMGVEIDALLLDLSQHGQGKHLKAAAVSENGAVPIHKLVQAAQGLDHVLSGTDVKMIGVG